MKLQSLLLVVLLSAFASDAGAQPKSPPSSKAVAAAVPAEFNDADIFKNLSETAEELMNAGKSTAMTNLMEQLKSRKTCNVKLPAAPTKKLTNVEFAAKSRAGVVVVGGLYKCSKCTRWHVQPASGFVLAENGVIATCYHVVNKPEHASLMAMTADGRVLPVKEVLAGDEASDVAILQLDATGLTPLPVSTDAPVGSPVRVISHPNQHFYMVTEGIVSRYLQQRKLGQPVSFMAITADFARGSSGGPVFNEAGAVIGIVNHTQSLYYTEEAGKKDNLQMVFKHATASKHLLDLVKP